MSGCYHLCPTNLTFQFDTTFMYIMIICMCIKIYQGRHPDISIKAFTAYLLLGTALTLEVN